MPKTSAGLILYRKTRGKLEVLLVHPGGPLWAKKDLGAWSIPKGELDDDQADYLATAKREFAEETGFLPPNGEFISLGSITQKHGKIVHAWACEGDVDTKTIKSNTFSMEWPPHSGREQPFPEIDRGEFFTIAEAHQKIKPAQMDLLLRLQEIVGG
jgi:predicted NUDIX family NTP pyrophosphohydrolase